MACMALDVHPYTGNLSFAQILDGKTTISSDHFGSVLTGKLTDHEVPRAACLDEGSWFNDTPITHISTGFARSKPAKPPADQHPRPCPVIAFEAKGRIYFHYPDATPCRDRRADIVVKFTRYAYNAPPSTGLCGGTLILTSQGEIPIEQLKTGDRIMDHRMRCHRIKRISETVIDPASLPRRKLKQVLPVRITANGLKPGVPHQDLRLSQQHRIHLESALIKLQSGLEEALVPAKSLTGHIAGLDKSRDRITYYQITCEDHAILMANGMPCEGRCSAEPAARITRDTGLEILPEKRSAPVWHDTPLRETLLQKASSHARQTLSFWQGRKLCRELWAVAPNAAQEF